MMARPVATGPRLTKRARERKHEQEKADKALGGATMVQVEGEDATKKVPHWYVELQWFRLLRGQKRLNQIARILVELAPAKVFDPRDIYLQHLKEEAKLVALQNAEEAADAEKNGSKKKDKAKKLSKKEQIIAANQAKKQKEAVARDTEKLRSLGNVVGTQNIKLKTESGKLLLLLQILKKAVASSNVVNTLDTMWEIEEVAKEIDPKEAKVTFKQFSDVIKGASEIRNDRSQLGNVNLVDFQLTQMSDRLPPLNLHSLSGKFKLDAWQLHVINLVNQKKSVLITAPTSSGKTVLSTYACTAGGRVLFVVPSEPLAWQVAAMLRALKLDVSIVVPTLNYVPPKFDVVVGTPHALESSLTKQIGFNFDYAVFDEVHSLNNADGPALQRLIRAIPNSCKVMALSATIGNAQDLIRWWETIVGEGNIELVVHKSRFINLQRYVWLGAEETSPLVAAGTLGPPARDAKGEPLPGTLQLLHPCATLSVEYLCSEEYASSDIAFTPVDTFNLYKSMEALLPAGSSVSVEDLKPKNYFKALGGGSRITLMQAKGFEDKLKERLVQVARQEPELGALLLASLSPGADIKKLKKARKAALAEGADMKAWDREAANTESASVRAVLGGTVTSTSKESLCDLFFHLLKTDLLPAICFQLDSVRCQGMFDGLLRELEERETATHPDYRINLQRQAKGLEKIREKADKKGDKKGKKKGDADDAASEAQAAQEFGDAGAEKVDPDLPHPDFVFTPPGRGMGAAETRDVIDKLGDDLPNSGDLPHPLIRGLRRGIGMYIEGLPSAYHRLVQAFAQQGRLGVVFSDELLAYGVNMPFRACVFFGDPGAEWMTPLVHQQMAGRAGRRGLDRQGHLVYAGFEANRLRSLLRGQLPDVVGRFPLYPSIPLQLEMSSRYEVSGQALTPEIMTRICSQPLAEYLKGASVDNYYAVAEQWIDALGVLKHPPSSYAYLIPELVWELRQFLPESLAIEYVIEHLIKKYRDTVIQYKDADVNQQTSVFLLFTRICARKPFVPIEADEQLSKEQLAALEWVKPLPAPASKNEEWDEWTALIDASQQRILDLDLPYKEPMLLPHHGQELDNMCYAAFVRNQIDPSLPTPVQHELRQRVWSVGEVMRICSNILGRSAELQPLQNLIRKAFVRIRYILDETSQRNWKKLDQKTILAGDATPPAAP